MFKTCAFCNARFDGDGGPSGLGVGRRLAFDEWKARLWVVCPKCSRWNLSPLDDRLERVEAVARVAPTGHVVSATGQVALIRWGRYDLVRVGQPLRPELAVWRYGARLKAQARERARVVVPLTIAALGLGLAANVAAGGSLGIFVWNLHSLADSAYLGLVGLRRLRLAESRVCARCGVPMVLRARHMQHARVIPASGDDVAVIVNCPRCHGEGGSLAGAEAGRALRQGLTYLNARRRARRRAEDAARVVDRAGGPNELLLAVAREESKLRALPADRRLALEMAMDEREEIRELERQWHEAEETAEIADGLLSPSPEIEQQLRRLRRRARLDQPTG